MAHHIGRSIKTPILKVQAIDEWARFWYCMPSYNDSTHILVVHQGWEMPYKNYDVDSTYFIRG